MKLQTKLAVFGTGIALMAVLLVAFISSFSTRLTLTRLLANDERERAQATMEKLQIWRQNNGSWQQAYRVLEQIGVASQQEVLIVNDEGRGIISYPADLCKRLVAVGPGKQLKMRSDGPHGAHVMELFGVPESSIANDSGVGRRWKLFVMPSESSPPGMPAQFTSSMKHSLWIGGGVAALVALCISFVLARTLLKPVNELVSVVSKMKEGDFSLRTTFCGQDEVGSLGAAFNSMAAELHRHRRLRDDLFHDIAHELRTPLTNIRCQLESFQDGLAVPSSDLIDSLHEETMLLSRLVDDLRDIALAEAGQLGVEIGEYDAIDELRRIILMAGPLASSRSVQLLLDAPPAIWVRADQGRFTQIVNNLLSNAIQHTPTGCFVTVRARPEQLMAIIEVEDNGAGIPEEHLPFIFDRFYCADPVRSRKSGGAGLGLAIVQRLAALQGGSIGVKNSLNHGCCFVLRIPLLSVG